MLKVPIKIWHETAWPVGQPSRAALPLAGTAVTAILGQQCDTPVAPPEPARALNPQ